VYLSPRSLPDTLFVGQKRHGCAGVEITGYCLAARFKPQSTLGVRVLFSLFHFTFFMLSNVAFLRARLFALRCKSLVL
jgi:hypothetical protein